MADGTTKPISEIEIGEWVIAEALESGERGAREVTSERAALETALSDASRLLDYSEGFVPR